MRQLGRALVEEGFPWGAIRPTYTILGSRVSAAAALRKLIPLCVFCAKVREAVTGAVPETIVTERRTTQNMLLELAGLVLLSRTR